MADPRVTAVIVTHNSRGVIGEALDEAFKAHQTGLLEVVIVDNASGDGTLEFVRDRYPWVRIVQSPGNVGFGRGCNAGLAAATTQYVLFLNPDAVLPTDSLKTLISFLDNHPNAIFAAPATENYGGSQLQAAGGLPSPLAILRGAAGLPTNPGMRRPIQPGAKPFQTDWLGGGIMLGRCEELRKLGAFDPRFFLYFEETDLCKRAIAAGYELWAVGQATARHAGGTAAKGTGRKLYRASIAEHYFRSRFYYLIKHFGWIAAVWTDLAEVALLAARATAKRVFGRGGGELAERLSGPVLRLPDPVPTSQPG
jgi:GT2 family glycosyltransferase